ncbi:reverse transcriptase domain-containing protein [Tanacetum coccineum]
MEVRFRRITRRRDPTSTQKNTLQAKPSKKSRFAIKNVEDLPKQIPVGNADFYNKPFTFIEMQDNIRNLVASPFTARIRDYNMPDGLKVPINLKIYDGMSDPDDHLTVFMGTMDVHKLPELAWCHFFHITLSGAARFKGKNQIDWKQKVVVPKARNKVLMIDEGWSPSYYQEVELQHKVDISFTSDDPVPYHCSGDDPLVIQAEIGGNYTRKGSKTITTDFIIVRAPSPYNVILGRPGIRQLGAIASTIHSLIKFPLKSCITITRGNVPHKHEAVIHVMRRSWVAVMEIMPIDHGLRGAFYRAFYRAFYGAFKEKARGYSRRRSGASTGPSTGRRPRALTWASRRRSGASRRRSGVFFKLNRGIKRRLHPLGEYIITLYTNGKLRTKVTVMLERIEKTKRSKNSQKPTRNGKKTKETRKIVKNSQRSQAGSARHRKKESQRPQLKGNIALENIPDSQRVSLVVKYGPCLPYGKCARLQQRLQHGLLAAMKAATKVTGYREGCHIVGRLLQRLHNRGFCEGCNEALWLMRRLPHRLKADAKAAIKVAGFYKGCHIAEKVATLLKKLYKGYGLNIIHKTNPNRASYEGRDALTLRLRGGAFYGAFEGPSTGPLRDLLQGLLRGLRGEGQGVFEEKVRGFDRDFYREKAKGFDRAFADKVGAEVTSSPVCQKKRILAKDRNEAITTEVTKFVEARILKEVYFLRWVANPVMVRKSDGTWRMCIDFTNMNKACPKDSYPLPEIDKKIESLDGFKYKYYLDTYKGYHQIRMAKEDEEKTAFYSEHRTFCYEKMPFGLKNAGATYQWLVDKAFSSQIGQNIEIYVDNMVIKRKNEGESGQFLRHLITKQGIEPNPKKVKAIIDMVSPRTIREVQSLKGKLSALGRFLTSFLKNKRADALSKLASSSFAHLTKKVLVEVIPCQITKIKKVITVEEPGTTWMDPIISYLEDGHLPEDLITTRKIRIKAP